MTLGLSLGKYVKIWTIFSYCIIYTIERRIKHYVGIQGTVQCTCTRVQCMYMYMYSMHISCSVLQYSWVRPWGVQWKCVQKMIFVAHIRHKCGNGLIYSVITCRLLIYKSTITKPASFAYYLHENSALCWPFLENCTFQWGFLYNLSNWVFIMFPLYLRCQKMA